MTYTYKISRRLAISRALVAPTVLALFTACAGDTTAPEDSGPTAPSAPTSPGAPLGFRVLPNSVTVEVDQTVRFRGHLNSARAGLRLPRTRWEASGGTISADGVFAASRPGTYRVVGRSRIHRPDTSIVVVVPRQPLVQRVRVTPRTPELDPGHKRTFSAVGRLPDGTHTAIRVNWSATGGAISEAGIYVAGDEPGTYHVIARSLRGGIADTIPVAIRGRSAKPAARATRIVLRPTSVTLAPTTAQQFAAFGRTADGDSVPVEVTFRATGGTITESGLFTAGQNPGSFRVVATAQNIADTSLVTLALTSGGGTPEPSPSPDPEPSPGAGSGIPFGHFKEPLPGSPLRSGGYLIVPQGQLEKLPSIRSRGGQVVVNVVGGGKCALDSSGQFQMELWRACWRLNLTPANRQRILAYADSGVVAGTYLIDEPNLLKRWGVITPQQVCEMARHARSDLPGIPVIVRAAATWIGSCDAIDAVWAQYGSRRKVAVETYRAEHVAAAKAHGYALIFSLNALNDDGAGTDMTARQVIDYGTVLMGRDICAFYIWEYATAWSERPEIRTALDALGRVAESLPRRGCQRP